jgi:putative ABC transport system ATP-binding protein
MIALKDVTKLFRTSHVETVVLSDINLEIAQGEFVAIMGPSGCGKSTLLNILGMIDTCDKGEITFNGVDLTLLSDRDLSKIRKENVGFIFQSFNLIDELNVFENVEIGLMYRNPSVEERRERVTAALAKMGISHRANHMPSQLSGGQQQRVAIARALVANPKLILADEPTGNLDSHHGKEVMQLLKSLHLNGATIVMVTHSSEHAGIAERCIEMIDGKIVGHCAYLPCEKSLNV